MIKLKKLLTLCLIFTLCSGSTVFAKESVAKDNTLPSIDGTSIYVNSNDKQTFAVQMDDLYSSENQNHNIKVTSRKEIESLMLKAAIGKDVDKDEINQQLAEYGCYEMSLDDSKESLLSSSGTNDVVISTPTVYYNAYNKTWTVTCGGYWKTTAWNKFLPGDVGGADGFGVGFTNTSTYRSSVVSSSGYITDGNRYVSTSYRSDGEGSQGFGFRLQDYIYATDLGYTYNYVGAQWSGLCNYDSSFGTYSGIATAYYIHTYDSASLSSVQFGMEGKTAGISANISRESNSFTGFSGDKTFGVY